jgi:hypothetical protein
MAVLEESETIINYDYASKVVHIFTTYRGVYKNIVKRIGEVNIPYHGGDLESGWSIKAPMKYFREPFCISKVIK